MYIRNHKTNKLSKIYESWVHNRQLKHFNITFKHQQIGKFKPHLRLLLENITLNAQYWLVSRNGFEHD